MKPNNRKICQEILLWKLAIVQVYWDKKRSGKHRKFALNALKCKIRVSWNNFAAFHVPLQASQA